MELRRLKLATWLLAISLAIGPAWADDDTPADTTTPAVTQSGGGEDGGTGDSPREQAVPPSGTGSGTDDSVVAPVATEPEPGPLGVPPTPAGDEGNPDENAAPPLATSLAREGDDPNIAATRAALGLPSLDGMRSDDPNQAAFGNRNLMRQGDRIRNPDRVGSYEDVQNRLAVAGAVASVALPVAHAARGVYAAGALGSRVAAGFAPVAEVAGTRAAVTSAGEAVGARAAVTSAGEANLAQAERLRTGYRFLENPSGREMRTLADGRMRAYEPITPPRTPGEMQGARGVQEWNPVTGNTRYWRETLDQAGNIRQVRPELGGPKTHYRFDEAGRFQPSRTW